MRGRIQVGIYFLLMCQMADLMGLLRKNEDFQSVLKKEIQAISNMHSLLLHNITSFQKHLDQLVDLMTEQLPLDCSGAKARGDWRLVTKIKPPGLAPRKVRCEQYSNGGGWTVIVYRNSEHLFFQKKNEKKTRSISYHHPDNTYGKMKDDSYRSNKWEKNVGSPPVKKAQAINFNRTWNEYKEGFGRPEEEYWIGNEVLQALTHDRGWEAAVVLEDWSGRRGHALWNSLRVRAEDTKYRLEISGYDESRSNLGDGLAYHNGKAFSTFDADNEDYDVHCAEKYGGGWWFNQCHVSHLTGTHLNPGAAAHHAVHWLPWKKSNEALKVASLMIRPPKATTL